VLLIENQEEKKDGNVPCEGKKKRQEPDEINKASYAEQTDDQNSEHKDVKTGVLARGIIEEELTTV